MKKLSLKDKVLISIAIIIIILAATNPSPKESYGHGVRTFYGGIFSIYKAGWGGDYCYTNVTYLGIFKNFILLLQTETNNSNYVAVDSVKTVPPENTGNINDLPMLPKKKTTTEPDTSDTGGLPILKK